MEIATEDSAFPPTPERVAARALVLSAVSCRALIEKDAGKPGAEQLRQDVLPWLDRIGISNELEQRETDFLSTPLGQLDKKSMVENQWYCEGMVVLAWVLGCTALPPFYSECDPTAVAHALGFLEERSATVLLEPQLRKTSEITDFEQTYLTLHWRLRQFAIDQCTMDFSAYVSSCNWGPLRLDKIELCDNDLSIEGTRLDRLGQAQFRKALGVVQERHRAFNWLIGWDSVYSAVTTDT